MSRNSISIQIKKNEFRAISKRYPTLVSQVVRKTAFDVIQYARPNTPVGETGNLSSNVSVVEFSDLRMAAYWAMEYAIYQELGTRYINGKFFATNAAETARQPYIDAIKAIRVL